MIEDLWNQQITSCYKFWRIDSFILTIKLFPVKWILYQKWFYNKNMITLENLNSFIIHTWYADLSSNNLGREGCENLILYIKDVVSSCIIGFISLNISNDRFNKILFQMLNWLLNIVDFFFFLAVTFYKINLSYGEKIYHFTLQLLDKLYLWIIVRKIYKCCQIVTIFKWIQTNLNQRFLEQQMI